MFLSFFLSLKRTLNVSLVKMEAKSKPTSQSSKRKNQEISFPELWKPTLLLIIVLISVFFTGWCVVCRCHIFSDALRKEGKLCHFSCWSRKSDIPVAIGLLFHWLFIFQPFGHNQTQAAILENNTILKAREVEFPAKPVVSNEAKVKSVKLCCRCATALDFLLKISHASHFQSIKGRSNWNWLLTGFRV